MPPPIAPGRWRPQHRTRAYQRLRRRILDAFGWRCACAGCRACYRPDRCRRAGRLELHHVIPVADGGDDADANLIPLCRPCHFAAHGRGPGPDRSEWRAEIARRLAPP